MINDMQRHELRADPSNENNSAPISVRSKLFWHFDWTALEPMPRYLHATPTCNKYGRWRQPSSRNRRASSFCQASGLSDIYYRDAKCCRNAASTSWVEFTAPYERLSFSAVSSASSTSSTPQMSPACPIPPKSPLSFGKPGWFRGRPTVTVRVCFSQIPSRKDRDILISARILKAKNKRAPQAIV